MTLRTATAVRRQKRCSRPVRQPTPRESSSSPKCRPSTAAAAIRSRIAAAEEASVPVEAPDITSGALPARRAMTLCEDLFRDHPGALIRERCRDEMFAKDEKESVRDLVYGEFGFLSLVAFFKKHRDKIPRSGAVCYDLGSGVGRPVFAAAMLHPFARVVGMECLEGLHALGAELAQLYDAEVAPAVAAAVAAAAAAAAAAEGCEEQAEGEEGRAVVVAAPAVQLVRCDFLVDDSWSEADVVLVNSCCFSQALFASIEARAVALLKPGSLVVTLRQKFVNVAGEHREEATTTTRKVEDVASAVGKEEKTDGSSSSRGGARGDEESGGGRAGGGAAHAVSGKERREEEEEEEELVHGGYAMGEQSEEAEAEEGEAAAPPRGECWELLEATERRMSWGPSMMFVYRRTDAPPPASGCE